MIGAPLNADKTCGDTPESAPLFQREKKVRNLLFLRASLLLT
jgi:hypothetical protein